MTDSNGLLADRNEAALVLIDLQERLVAVMDERERVLAGAVRLARTFALVGAPIIVTRQYPQGLGSTEPVLETALLELAEAGSRVLGVDKTTFCCSREPAFLEALSATGRSQVVIAGMETHICVVQTALALTAHGFRVHVVHDACCSRRDCDHDIALSRLRACRVTVTSAESVMYEAVGRSGTDEFRRLLSIVKAG